MKQISILLQICHMASPCTFANGIHRDRGGARWAAAHLGVTPCFLWKSSANSWNTLMKDAPMALRLASGSFTPCTQPRACNFPLCQDIDGLVVQQKCTMCRLMQDYQRERSQLQGLCPDKCTATERAP